MLKFKILILCNFYCFPFILFGQNNCNCSDNSIDENLIANFPFIGNSHEVIGNTFHGRVNGAALTAGYDDSPNTAYFFDGRDDKIEVGDHFDLNQENFSISCWVNVYDFEGLTSGTNSYGGWIINKGLTIYGTPRQAGYALDARKVDGENQFNFFVGGQNNQVYRAKGDGFEEQRWYFIVAVKDQESISLYVDNILVSREIIQSGLNVDTNIPLVFGSIDKLGNDAAGTTYFYGKISDVKIFSKALTCEERECLLNHEETPLEPCQVPVVDLGDNKTLRCQEDFITLDASFPGSTYEWQDGSTNASFTVSKSGTYSVKVQNSCGISYDSVDIYSEETVLLKVPNVFTPNNDAYNQFFKIDKRLIGAKLKIYLRTGKMVYESDHYNNDWDGRNLNSGTYYFVLEDACYGKIKGWLQILY